MTNSRKKGGKKGRRFNRENRLLFLILTISLIYTQGPEKELHRRDGDIDKNFPTLFFRWAGKSPANKGISIWEIRLDKIHLRSELFCSPFLSSITIITQIDELMQAFFFNI
jgi:hypothetical protein